MKTKQIQISCAVNLCSKNSLNSLAFTLATNGNGGKQNGSVPGWQWCSIEWSAALLLVCTGVSIYFLFRQNIKHWGKINTVNSFTTCH